jgi:iron complex transport system ATP-binding protein
VSGVTFEAVSVTYEARVVVRELYLEVSAGEWVGLIGPNGAGKTTVLRAAAGLVPHAGRIGVGPRALAGLGAKEIARLIAYVPQSPQMPAGMSVAQYVLLGRSPHLSYLGREGSRDREVVSSVLRRLSLDELAARPLDRLSGGERQRAAIARALAQESPVLLVDEPTSSLDVGTQQDVLELIDGLRAERGLTVIAAMHDLTLAGQYSDRLVLIVGGEVRAVGPPAAVLTEQAIGEHYGARVRVLRLPGAGHVVAPIRSPPTCGTARESAP